MDQKTSYLPPPDAINFRELLLELWRLRIAVAGAMVVCALGGVAAGVLMDKQYEASIVLSPADDNSASGRLGGLASIASSVGGLASLAGLSMPGKTKKDEVLAVLESELLTEAYIRENNLLPILYSKQWDPATGKWTTDDPKKVPTLWKANRYFNKRVRDVKEDRKSGLIVMTIRWKDPATTAKWANELVKKTNDYLRAKAIRESEHHIDYLNDQLTKITIVDAQKAIWALLQEELNTQMIAKGREEYALKVIDPAVVPEVAVSPGPKLLGALGFLLGGFLAIATVASIRTLRTLRS
jgi:uncharacterized protein involved in exopolysaccharide biosynthesis